MKNEPTMVMDRSAFDGLRFHGHIPEAAIARFELHANSFERWAVEHANRKGATAADWLIGLQTIFQALERLQGEEGGS